jgi:hypothetical protein
MLSKPTPANCQMRDLMLFLSLDTQTLPAQSIPAPVIG